LVRFETAATNHVVAWCLETHDLWIAKAIAGHPKDLEFCRALSRRGLVSGVTLRKRLAKVAKIDSRIREAVSARIGQP
jgi:hypothetical protein